MADRYLELPHGTLFNRPEAPMCLRTPFYLEGRRRLLVGYTQNLIDAIDAVRNCAAIGQMQVDEVHTTITVNKEVDEG